MKIFEVFFKSEKDRSFLVGAITGIQMASKINLVVLDISTQKSYFYLKLSISSVAIESKIGSRFIAQLFGGNWDKSVEQIVVKEEVEED